MMFVTSFIYIPFRWKLSNSYIHILLFLLKPSWTPPPLLSRIPFLVLSYFTQTVPFVELSSILHGWLFQKCTDSGQFLWLKKTSRKVIMCTLSHWWISINHITTANTESFLLQPVHYLLHTVLIYLSLRKLSIHFIRGPSILPLLASFRTCKARHRTFLKSRHRNSHMQPSNLLLDNISGIM